MWTELVRRLDPDCRFGDPATPIAIAQAEHALAVRFPDELRSVYAEADGLFGQYDLPLVWPVQKVAQENLRFRRSRDFPKLYMPFDHLLFIGDAGSGDQFAYSILAGEIRRTDVFAWNHEDDSRIWVAPNLQTYIEWWLTGRIKL